MNKDKKHFIIGIITWGTIAFGIAVIIIEISNLVLSIRIFDITSMIIGIMIAILGIILYIYEKKEDYKLKK